MITGKQVEELSKLYQIDEFTIRREYLQLVFLSYLYQIKEAKNIYFKGGTAVRLLFGSARFSEDLDFSTTYSKIQIRKIIKEVERSINQEIPGLQIFLLYSGKEGERFRIKYQADESKYPLVIRLDFHQVKRIGKTAISPLLTKFPIVIFPLISHLDQKEILSEKIRALITRGKGRDFFDVWYLLEKGVVPAGKINKKIVVNKIKKHSQARLNRDLSQFLPKPQRMIIGMLKMKLGSYFS